MAQQAVFHHFGVPDSTKYQNARCVEGAGLSVTDPERHPYRVEFLRFEANSPMPEEIKKTPHAAFMVPDLDAALKGRNVILPKTDLGALFIAFIKDGEAVIELMQPKAPS